MTATTTRFPSCRRRPRFCSLDAGILVQPTKPKQLMKPKMEIRSNKVSALSDSNAFRSEISQSRNGPLDTSSASIPSIFVQKSFDEDINDNWTLKRANPVYDSDDEDIIVMNSSPSKKQCIALDWGNRLTDENNGFSINL